jgi:hypothetical protein
MAFVPPFAPLVVLAFLGTAALLFLAVLAVAVAVLARWPRLARVVGFGAMTVAGVCVGLLLLLSVTSRQNVLPPGGKKYFCEIDCHLAYSVEDVAWLKRLDTEAGELRPGGTFCVVKVRTWFDPATIAPFRGNGPLTPNPRRITAVDERGRQYEPSDPAIAALLASGRRDSTPIIQALRPGESYTTSLVFDLPDTVRSPLLLITGRPSVERFLLGHEDSLLHKKVFFSLGTRN